MQLSKFSDYSFRALIYLAENNHGLNTIEHMASELKISQNHLKKIIHKRKLSLIFNFLNFDFV